MTNELATQGTKELASAQMTDWDFSGVDSQDILIPKTLMMQGLS